jgi:hypothetical protein
MAVKKAAPKKRKAATKKSASPKAVATKKAKATTTPISTEAKIARRKIDALKRGIHRISDEDTMPFSVSVVGIGKAGADIITQILKDKLSETGDSSEEVFHALAIDIGDQDLKQIDDLLAKLPEGVADVETVAIEVPERDDLFNSLRRMREFLKLEYPRYYWNPNYEPWLPSKISLPKAGDHFKRSVAKALYARSYYEEPRSMRSVLKRFSEKVDNSPGQSVVSIVYGLGGGTGSGVMVDMARHLSNICFGRRVLVVGVAIAPCEGDEEAHKGSHLFPAINELDCMGDEEKNKGVIAVWGDLYRNPFTSGVIIVPQKPVWDATQDLKATHERVDREVSSFLTRNKGVDLWETLRMLNWVGAPPTQHAAARTPYGNKWAHVLGFADVEDGITATDDMASRMGIRDSYKPEFIEVRAVDPEDAKITKIASTLSKAFSSTADPGITPSAGDNPGSVQFILPCISKLDLDLFFDSRDAYDPQTWEEKLTDHAWLLDLGVLLCEPAIRFNGMAGECLWGCACWVVVPYDQIRGPDIKQVIKTGDVKTAIA